MLTVTEQGWSKEQLCKLRFAQVEDLPLIAVNTSFHALFPYKTNLIACIDPVTAADVRATLYQASGAVELVLYMPIQGDTRQLLLRGTASSEKEIEGILLDITPVFQHAMRLQQKEQCYRQAMRASCSASFDADLHANTITYNGCPQYECLRELKTYNDFISAMCVNMIYPDDRTQFERMFALDTVVKAAHMGQQELQCEYRSPWPSQQWMQMTLNLVCLPNNTAAYAYARIINIDERKRGELILRRVAERDELTGLYNRRVLQARTDQILRSSLINGEQNVLIMMDLDDFKDVNDTYGHARGDETLISFAAALRVGFRKMDIVGRLGGDEFVVFMHDVENIEAAIARADRIREYGAAQCSIGLAVAPRDGVTFSQLYRKADIALYEAKRSGKGCVKVYDQTLEEIDYGI